VGEYTAKKQRKNELEVERKKVQRDLRERESFNRELMENAPNPVLVTNTDSSIRYLNPAFEKLTGFAFEELFGCKSPYPWWPKEDITQFEDANVEGRNKDLNILERRYLKKNGEPIWVTSSIRPVTYDGKVEYYLSNWVDITQRKILEEEVRRQRDRAQTYLDVAGVIIVAIDSLGKVSLINKKGCEILGFKCEEVIGRDWFDHFLPERDRASVRFVFDQLKAEKADFGEYAENRVLTRQGGERVIAWHNTVLRDEAGNFAGTLSSGQDVTERKRAEELLRESEDRYKLMFESAPIAINITRGTQITYANPSYLEMFGFSSLDELKLVAPLKLFAPEWRPKIKENIQRRENGLPVPSSYEAECLRGNGTRFPVLMYLSRATFADGPSTVAFTEDITERKEEEQALKKSEEKYRLLYETMMDGYVRVRMDGLILESNAAFKAMVGYSEKELKSLTYADITPAKWHAMEAQIVRRQILKKGYSEIYQKEYRRKDGTIIPIELRTYLVTNHAGHPIEMWATVRDISERNKAEEALKLSQEQLRKFSLYLQEQLEAEKKYLAAEIHDEIGQMLTGLKIDLAWLAKRLPAGAEALAEKTCSMSTLIDETDKVTKRIVADLRPTILDDLGLQEAMRWLVKQFKTRTGIRCRLLMDSDEFSLDKERSVDVFRIAQEALTNVSRHSGASEVRIRLRLIDQLVMLHIADNGKGISEQQVNDRNSFGLMGMRERARKWGGELRIMAPPGRGTVISLRLPLGIVS
jgi:PAS domain S-box-containing protein